MAAEPSLVAIIRLCQDAAKIFFKIDGMKNSTAKKSKARFNKISPCTHLSMGNYAKMIEKCALLKPIFSQMVTII